MALFLTEAVSQSTTYQGNYIDLLIEQSEIQSELLALNEAIYQADFIIHERSRTLTESAAIVLQEGFLGNVWEKVKAYVMKAIAWVKQFAKKIKDKVVELYNRVKDRIKGDAVEIAKSKIADMEAAVTFIEQNAKLQEKLKGQTNTEIIKSITEQSAKLKEDFNKKKEANAKLTGTQKVSFTYFDKLIKASQMNETVSGAVARDFEAEIKALESKHAAELASAKADSANNADNARNASGALQAERDNNQANKQKAKGIIDGLQAEITAMKAAAAAQMELSRNAGAVLAETAGKLASAQAENASLKAENDSLKTGTPTGNATPSPTTDRVTKPGARGVGR